MFQSGCQDQAPFLVLYGHAVLYFSLWLVGTGTIPCLMQVLMFVRFLCPGGSFPGRGYLPHIHELMRWRLEQDLLQIFRAPSVSAELSFPWYSTPSFVCFGLPGLLLLSQLPSCWIHVCTAAWQLSLNGKLDQSWCSPHFFLLPYGPVPCTTARFILPGFCCCLFAYCTCFSRSVNPVLLAPSWLAGLDYFKLLWFVDKTDC